LCLLCSECNAADGKAKSWSRAAIDPKFSFTAQEIGRFVRARGGQDHDIDYEKALNIWEAERSNFLARLALIDELLAHLVSGRLARDYQGKSDARGVCSAFDPLTLLAQSFYHETKDTERAVLLEDFRQEFLARSTQRDSAKLLPSIEYKRAVAPTDEEYTAYVDPVSGKSWQAIPEDWTCPVCERGKRQILRKSKAGKWTGGVRSHYEYALETDPTVIAKRRRLFPNYRNDIFVKKIATLSLCSDCTGIGTALSQRDQSIRFPYLGMADYRACIISSQPHAPHEIDFETASRCAIANDSYRPAEAAFTAFRSKVKPFFDTFN
jgi:hypothetical protein